MGIITGALIASTVVGAGSAYMSSQAQSEAAETGANAQLQSNSEANALQKEMYDQTRQDQEPWRLAGERALSTIESMPDFQFKSEDFDFMADPSYDWRVDQGVNALDRSAASRGRVLSGAQDKSVTRYGQDMASQEYENAFRRHQSTENDRFNKEQSVYNTNLTREQSLAGVGQSATNFVGNAGANMANQVGSNTRASGNALASMYQQQGQASANAWTGGATALNQNMGNYLLYDIYKG